MGIETGISWTDHTFNPVWGCTKVSPGCDNCYAETFDKRVGGGHWGKGAPRREFKDAHWNEPLHWNRDAAIEGRIAKVFCGSMCDVMDDEWPDGVRERLWSLIDATHNLYWQLLTKRPHRYRKYLPKNGFAFDNVILGCTTEAQAQYDARIGELDQASAHLHDRNQWRNYPATMGRPRVPYFVSYEPALGPITMNGRIHTPDWLIFGGESGPGRRPMEIEWAENIKRECEERGVAFFMKQVSAKSPKEGAALIPAHLLVRDFPVELTGTK